MEDPNFIFSSGPIELKEEGNDFFVEGYISTSDLDLVNDIVTKDCIMDMAEQMKARTIKLDVEHESFRGKSGVELEINKTIIPAAKIDDFLVDKKGLKIRAMLNRHVQRFNEVKNSIKDGFLDAFSIAFIPTKARVEERAGQEVRLLDKINLLNVAFTGNPVNTYSTMTNVFAKSLEFLKEQETESKRKHSAKWHRLVDKLKKIGKVRSPEAVATEVLGEESYKSYDHDSDKIKLKEVKKMSEEDNKEETQEAEEAEKTEEPSESESEEKAKKKPADEEEEDEEKKKKVSKKDEEESESEESEPEKSEEESKESETEEKSEIETLKKDMMEVKSVLKKPMLKSRVEQKDKSENFVEEKALNPLDVIA